MPLNVISLHQRQMFTCDLFF